MATTDSHDKNNAALRSVRRSIGSTKSKVREICESIENLLEGEDETKLLLQKQQMQLQAELEDLLSLEQAIKDFGNPKDENPKFDELSVDNQNFDKPNFDNQNFDKPNFDKPNSKRLPQLSKIDLPSLTDTYELRSHYRRVEAILSENDIGQKTSDNLFCPTEALRFSILVKFGQTLKVERIRDCFTDLTNYCEDWTMIKTHLLNRFATRNVLIEEQRRKLKRLNWPHSHDAEEFVERARAIWRMSREIYATTELQKRELIGRMCELIPSTLLTQLFTLLKINCDEDWEYEIVFDDLTSESFCGALLACSKIHKAASMYSGGSKPTSFDTTLAHTNPRDKVKMVGDKFNTEDYFPNVLVVSTRINVSGKTLREIEDKIGKLPHKPYTARSGKSRGYFIGLKTKDDLDSLAKQMEGIADCTAEQYKRNTTAPPLNPKDKVARIATAPCEYVVKGKIEVSTDCVLDKKTVIQVDSGAGFNYIIATPALLNQIRHLTQKTDESFSVLLANNTMVTVEKMIRAQVSLYGVEHPDLSIASMMTLFYILPSQGHESPQILLGRESIADFDLTITKAGVSINGSMLMETAESGKICIRSVQNQVPQDPISTVLTNVTARGWVPLMRSPEYAVRLTELPLDEPRDHAEQTHAFEVRIPKSTSIQDQSPPVVQGVEGQTKAMLHKLPFSKRETQKELVNNYVKLGWWEVNTPDECKRISRFSPVSVFMVSSSLRKPRLVVNFKPVNSLLPESSTPGTMPAHLIAALRSQSPECIVVCDASSAFYKIRIGEGDCFWLVVAIENDAGQIVCHHYISNRVVFGVVFGPSSLITSLNELFTENDQLISILRCFIGWYIDDNVLGGTAKAVVTSLENTICLLRRVGHDLQLTKSCAIATPAALNEFTELLSRIGTIAVTATAAVFGSEMSFDENGVLQIKCNQVTRNAALSQLANGNISSNFTKAEYFSFCGAISYDLMKEHYREKYIADCMRSVIGREFSLIGWESKLDLATLSANKMQAMRILFDWCCELRSNPPCVHQTRKRPNPGGAIEFNLNVDASSSGGGFCISIGLDTIWCDAWRWSGAETRWNINFQEVVAIDRALRTMADIIECLVRCTPATRQKPTINIFSDNRSAVSWSSLSSAELLSKHQSRRSLTRIIDSISCELKILKKWANVTIQHVSGCLNTRADELSRLGSRQLIPTTDAPTLADLVECERKKKSSPTNPIKEITVLAAIEQNFFEDDDEPFFGPPTDTENDYPDSHSFKNSYDLPDPICEPVLLITRVTQKSDSISKPKVLDSVHLLKNLDTANSLNTTEHVNSITDMVSTIESIAGFSYDLNNVHFYIRLLQSSLRAWFHASREETRELDDFDSSPDNLNLIAARMSQQKMSSDDYRNKLPIAMRSGQIGPLWYDEFKDVYFYRTPDPSGTYKAQLFIPRECKILQNLIIRHFHKQSAHMGVHYTMSRIDQFILHKPNPVAIIKNCLFCQRKNAERQFRAPFDTIHCRTNLLPYESVAVDHVALGDRREALVVMCMTTGHTSISLCQDMTADAAADAIKRVFYRYSTVPRFILADKASSLKNCVSKLAVFGSLEFTQTTAHSQFENGKLERMNSVALDILRCRLHFTGISLDQELSDLALQDLLDYVSHQMNQRPLGNYVNSPDGVVVITPHAILFGTSPATTCSSPMPRLFNSWLDAFHELHWKKLKMKSDLAIRARRNEGPFRINEPVLYYSPKAKSALQWHVAHVVDVISNRILLRDTNAKKALFWMNAYNVCPIKNEIVLAPTVNRIGASVRVVEDSITYDGTVIDEDDACMLLVRWSPKLNVTWPLEWRHCSTVTVC